MYCPNCGAQVSENTRFCPACGGETNRTSQDAPRSAGLRGFSPRIDDPAFAKYVKKTNRWSAILSIALAVAAVIGCYIAGEMGAEGMKNPQALLIGLGIGGMFLTVALFQILGRKRGATWDGTVEDKKIKKKTETTEDTSTNYLEYSVIIRSDQGKKHVIRNRNTDILYNYYRVGDRVRHHAGLNSYEKYDKTGDQFIPCNACGTLCDIQEDYCFRCKCPLLK
ncbi:MAG TPA: zinc ribbon domain-containing protein [Oscillospiraceae bacterium]|nr:zinc-ribbon domain-containing protein [Oscillospiraceae bacterium]HPV99829.1 zinc ribbon domain-containing protein [Oscillospiraceae bacterium]